MVSITKRAVFYDDCSDAERLVTDWKPATPADWDVAMHNGELCYRYSAVGSDTLANMVLGRLSDVEMLVKYGVEANGPRFRFLLRNSDNSGTYGVMHSVNITVFGTGGNMTIYFRYSGGWANIASMPHGITFDANHMYWLKARMVGRLLKVKIWQDGDPEPDWMINVYVTYGTEVVQATGHTYIAVQCGGGNDLYISDIRITPIPRYGGMP